MHAASIAQATTLCVHTQHCLAYYLRGKPCSEVIMYRQVLRVKIQISTINFELSCLFVKLLVYHRI